MTDSNLALVEFIRLISGSIRKHNFGVMEALDMVEWLFSRGI